MSKIPEAREMFNEALDLMECAIELLDRRKGHYRVRGSRATMTPALALKIRAWAATHRWTQQRIAEKFNVTNGRVSECLHGKH